jgi:hypothetical protein
MRGNSLKSSGLCQVVFIGNFGSRSLSRTMITMITIRQVGLVRSSIHG